MKVIICGAGQVGYNIARYLSSEKDNDITVVDQRSDLIRNIQDTLDVKAVFGHASHPDVLERAGARDTSLLIAVTAADEVNMIACQVAHSLFSIPTKIARVRSQEYLQTIWSDLFGHENIPIDVIISPEREIAKALTRLVKVPGVTEIIPLVDNKVQLVGVRCAEETPVLNTPLRQLSALFPDLHVVIVGIVRNGHPIVPSATDQMLPGDIVYFIVETAHVHRAMAAFGQGSAETHRALILGGGNIGLFLAQNIERDGSDISMRMVELGKERAEYIAKVLDATKVINGNVLDPEILQEAGVARADTVVALTNNDEANVLSAMLAKRYGAERTIALVNKTTYGGLAGPLGVDVVVSPRGITVSSILLHVRRGRIHAVHSLQDGFGEVIEAVAVDASSLVGRSLRELKLPSGVVVGAVVRGEKVIIPRGNTVIFGGDRVVLFAVTDAVKKVEKMFSVRLEYF